MSLIDAPPFDPDRLAALYAKVGEYKLAEEKERCEESLSEFVRCAWPYVDSADYQTSWALDAMCDHSEAVSMGHIRRLLINIPPRCAKTTIVSILYPMWVWAQSKHNYWSGPQVKFLCASYGHSLSLESANKARRVLMSPFYQQHWGSTVLLRPDQNAKVQFDTLAGGSYASTSVGGVLLGKGGDLLIGDDLNNTQQVESEAERETVANFWNEYSSTRLNDPKRSAIINVQQRLAKTDVSGLILESGERWVHLCTPMRYDTARTYHTIKLPQYADESVWDDPRVEEGELMWPERFHEAAVSRLEAALGPYMAAGRLQQSPIPKGGAILRREWWQPWDAVEARKYGLEWHDARKEFPTFELVVGSLDTAFGEKEENDFSAFTVWGVFVDRNGNRRAMLAYAWAHRLKLHGKITTALPGEPEKVFKARQLKEFGLVELIADTCKRYKVQRLLIEDKTRGRDVAQEINRLYARENWGVELINPVRDKVSRTHAIVPMFTDNGVWAPDTVWAEKVIEQCELFPKGDHDDLHDTVTMAMLWMREQEILIRGDEAAYALEDEISYRPDSTRTVASHYGV